MRMLLQFQKGDVIRYLGLLDMQRTMQRALRRSGLPIAYSNGFNPHILMSFASALSSGIPGDAELLEVGLAAPVDEETALSAMKTALPPALQPTRVRMVDDRFPKLASLMAFAGYRLEIRGAEGVGIAAGLSRFLAKEEILALRKTKTAEKMVNIRPMIMSLEVVSSDAHETVMDTVVSFTEASTLKPNLLMEALCRENGIQECDYSARRTALYTMAGGALTPLIDYQA